MLKFINGKNHIISHEVNTEIKVSCIGENTENATNLLLAVLKSYKMLGLNEEAMHSLVQLAFEENPNL